MQAAAGVSKQRNDLGAAYNGLDYFLFRVEMWAVENFQKTTALYFSKMCSG